MKELTLKTLVERAETTARKLFAGEVVPHRSCGITVAETFGVATQPYQALRRGGILGDGHCGAIKGGELLIGQLMGDPDPTGSVTPELRAAMVKYRALWEARIDRGAAETIVCNDMTGQFEDFGSKDRRTFCTNIAGTVAKCVAEVLVEHGIDFDPPEVS